MPRGKNFTAEQIIAKLREAEVGLARGKTVPEVVRKHGFRHRARQLRDEGRYSGADVARSRSVIRATTSA